MREALNCSLAKFSRLYSATSHNNPPLPNNEVDPELAAINGKGEDWWTPSSVNSKRRLDSRPTNSVTKIARNSKSPKKNDSANRFSELSNMDIDVKVSQTVSPNDTEKASTSTSNNNVVKTNVGNNPAVTIRNTANRLPAKDNYPQSTPNCGSSLRESEWTY